MLKFIDHPQAAAGVRVPGPAHPGTGQRLIVYCAAPGSHRGRLPPLAAPAAARPG